MPVVPSVFRPRFKRKQLLMFAPTVNTNVFTTWCNRGIFRRKQGADLYSIADALQLMAIEILSKHDLNLSQSSLITDMLIQATDPMQRGFLIIRKDDFVFTKTTDDLPDELSIVVNLGAVVKRCCSVVKEICGYDQR